MVHLLGQRLLEALAVALLASIAIFSVMRLIPGDPVAQIAGQDATPEQREQVRRELGLDKSMSEQYISWIADAVQLDFGRSFQNRARVTDLIRQALPPTVELAIAGLLVTLMIGVPLGVLSGLRPGGHWDHFTTVFTIATLGVPNFVLGLLLLMLFGVELGLLPVAGRTSFLDDPVQSTKLLIMPALALGGSLAATVARFVRASLIDVTSQDYIRTAWSKGLRGRTVVLRHALRNALLPVITVVALQIGWLLGGVIVIERVFGRPGFGTVIVRAVGARDYEVLQAMLLLMVVVFILVNTLADMTYAIVDPRLRSRKA